MILVLRKNLLLHKVSRLCGISVYYRNVYIPELHDSKSLRVDSQLHGSGT